MCVCVCGEREREREREKAPLTAFGAGEAAKVVDLIQSKASGLHANHRFTATSTVACEISKKKIPLKLAKIHP